MDSVKPKVLAPSRYVIDVEPIPPRNRNNKEVHLDYLKHLKESVETLREIVDEAKVDRPLDRSLASACLYTKHSQELLEYVIGTYPALCYPTNDSEDLGNLQPTANIGIFVGYAPTRKGYSIYNKRTRRIMETIHIQFDELFEPMAPMRLSSRPAPTFLRHGQISLGLVPNLVPAAPYVPNK
ncbi:hypothetical protein Tco_0833630 [Tanacetum coccineum]